LGLDDARGRDADEEPVGVAWIDHDGVDAGRELALRGRRSEPLRLCLAFAREQVAPARLVVPERQVELERGAAVAAHEETAGDGPDVHAPARAEADGPELEQRRRPRGDAP